MKKLQNTNSTEKTSKGKSPLDGSFITRNRKMSRV